MTKQDRVFGGFKVLSGDANYVDHGGTWYRKVDDGVYHVIQLFKWSEMFGDVEANADGLPTYNIQLAEVNLPEAGREYADLDKRRERAFPGSIAAKYSSDLEAALGSCGCGLAKGGVTDHEGAIVAAVGSDSLPLVCVDACFVYGVKEVIEDWSGNSWRKLMRAAVSASGKAGK